MKIQAILCFILFHLLAVSPAVEISIYQYHGRQRTAKVNTNQTEPSVREPRFNSDFTPTCNRPQEDPNIFRACHASGSPDFPAMHAVCKCTQCDWEVMLKCESDGAWYISETNVCTASYNCHKKCTIDDLGKAESSVSCSYIRIGGLIQIHECRCKGNCLKTEVRCDENEGWVIDETPCRDFIIDDAKEEGNLTFSYRNGLYAYGCEPGFILEGTITNRCDDGLLEGERPKCLAVALVELGKTEDKEKTAKDFDQSTGNFMSVPVAFITIFGIILILLTLALIGCGVWIWRLHKSRIPTVTSPAYEVPTPPTRIIAALAPNPTDSAYLELVVGQVTLASTSGPTSSMPAIQTPEAPSGQASAMSTDQVDGYGYLEPIQGTSGSTVIQMRPGDPNSPYADVLNLENNQVVAEYEYIRFNGRKM